MKPTFDAGCGPGLKYLTSPTGSVPITRQSPPAPRADFRPSGTPRDCFYSLKVKIKTVQLDRDRLYSSIIVAIGKRQRFSNNE